MTDGFKRKVLYILSPGYTGSTLLTLLLTTHPEVATIGERRALFIRLKDTENTKNRCKCGRVVPDCEYLSAAYVTGRRKLPFFMHGANYTRFKLSRNSHLNRILFRLARATRFGRNRGILTRWISLPFRRACEANAALMDTVMAAEGASVFLDSSKNPSDLRHMSASGLFDITVIHLSRDGRGRFHSLLRRHPWLSVDEAAESVVDLHDRVKSMLDEWDGSVIHVRYEDVCRDPLTELRRVASEAGLDPDGMSTDFADSCVHCIGNGDVIFSKSNEIVNRERWRTALDAEQFEAFERIAGESNRSFGYAD